MIQLNSYVSVLGFCLKEFLLAVASTVLSATMKYAAPATAIEIKPFSFSKEKQMKPNDYLAATEKRLTCGDY